jgi:hypothetical protein
MTSANDVKKLLNTDLTSNLASAIPSTQLNKVSSDVAATVLSAVTTNPEPVNVDGVSSNNPIGAGSSTVSRKNSLLADKVWWLNWAIIIIILQSSPVGQLYMCCFLNEVFLGLASL